MAINTYTVGQGTLTVGAGPLAVAAQIKSCKVTFSENVTKDEGFEVLSGERVDDVETTTYSAVIAGDVVQSLEAAGLVAWSWANKGTPQPFTFVPSTAEGREVSGTLVPIPLEVGGDVGSRAMSSFTWRCQGEPTLGDLVP